MGSSKSGGGVKETSYQRAQGEIAKERYADYVKNYQPLETKFVGEVRNELPGLQKQAQGITATDNAQRFNQSRAQVEQSLANRGVNLGSGRGISSISGSLADQATAKAGSVASATTAANQQHLSNLSALTQLGQGKSAGAIQGISSLADTAGKQAMVDARASAAARQALGQGIATVAGMGVGAYKNNQLDTQKFRQGGTYYLGDPNTAANYFNSDLARQPIDAYQMGTPEKFQTLWSD